LKAIDLPQHSLDGEDPRMKVFAKILLHRHSSEKNAEPKIAVQDLGLWVKNLWPQSVWSVRAR
jgi:hypothetical protein